MQDGLRPVLGFDDDVGLREGLVHVASLVAARLAHELAAPNRLLGVEQRLVDLPVDVDERERCACLAVRVGRDRRDSLPLKARLVRERVRLARADRSAHSRRGKRPREGDPLHARVCVRGAEDRCVKHSRAA